MTDYSRPYEVGLIDAGTSLRKAGSFGLKEQNPLIEFPRNALFVRS